MDLFGLCIQQTRCDVKATGLSGILHIAGLIGAGRLVVVPE